MKDPSNPVCRTISTLLSRIGDKWTVLVVQTLGEGSRRFNELRREIPSVSQRMLTLTFAISNATGSSIARSRQAFRRASIMS